MRVKANSWWAVSACALAIAVVLLAGYVTWSDRRTAIENALGTGRHLVATLEQHASRALEGVDYALRLATDRWNDRGPGPLDGEGDSKLLLQSLLSSPQILAISIFDAEGRRMLSSHREPRGPLDISDRDHFIQLRDHPAAGLVIGTPVLGRSSGIWEIPVGRAMRDSAGRFAGAVVAALDPDYFVQLYGHNELGQSGSIALLRRDGILLARAPNPYGDEKVLGQLPVPRPTVLDRLLDGDQADWEVPAGGTRPARLLSFRASAALPLIGVVTLGKDEALARWRAQAWRTMLSASAIAVLLVLFTMRLTREADRSRSAYAKLERAEARLRDAIDVLPEQLLIFDADDRLAMCNEAVRRLDHPEPSWSSIGYSFEEILRARLLQRDRKVNVHLQTRLEAHRNPGTPYDILLPSGESLRVIERRTAEGGIVLLRVDVTELYQLANELRQAKADAEQASVAKSELLASVSHEIRTPLCGIIGFTDLLLASPLAPEQRRQVMHVRTAGQSLLSFSDRMLNMSKIEAGGAELETRDFDLPALIDDCTAIINPAAAAKGLTVLRALDPSVPRLVRGDAGHLRQVLLNLLGNAVKFTDAGELSLKILPRPGSTEIEFIVRDTGIGISEADLPHLFTRFSQLGDGRRRAGGSGLGLAISRVLVELMGGQLTVESEPGRGSTFRFAIALPRAATAPQRVPAPVRPARVLLAEDALVNQELARAILVAAGHALDVVGDGRAAVEAARRERYDLVLMDMQLPQMDGVAAACEIRRLEPAHDRTPIIALTAGLGGPEDSCAALDGHLAKPVDAPTLLAIVARYAGQRSAVRPVSQQTVITA